MEVYLHVIQHIYLDFGAQAQGNGSVVEEATKLGEINQLVCSAFLVLVFPRYVCLTLYCMNQNWNGPESSGYCGFNSRIVSRNDPLF